MRIGIFTDTYPPFINGVSTSIKMLENALRKKGHKVYIVTATASENWPWKITWLKKYFPFFNTDNVVRMMDKSLFKCQVMIEDCLDQLMKNKLCHKVCLDYPWNRDENKDFIYDIRRCFNWNDILDAVNKIQEEINEWVIK